MYLSVYLQLSDCVLKSSLLCMLSICIMFVCVRVFRLEVETNGGTSQQGVSL